MNGGRAKECGLCGGGRIMGAGQEAGGVAVCMCSLDDKVVE